MLVIELSAWWLIALSLGHLLSIHPLNRTRLRQYALRCAVLLFTVWRPQSFPDAWRYHNSPDTRILLAEKLDDLAQPQLAAGGGYDNLSQKPGSSG